MERLTAGRSTKIMVFLLAFVLMVPASVFGQETVAKKDYYYEGQAVAELEYTGGGAMVGGLASGTLLGLIGWGIGYLIISSGDVSVPHHHVSGLDATQRMQFQQGYKDYVKKVKKGKFNMGAGIGTVIAVVLVLGGS